MTDEAAQPREPDAQDGGTASWTPPAGPPPSGGHAFASRYGLVRPLHGRYLAGVCAAIGRATNTDPVLWRVLLAVLGFFGGVGILIYVAAWLLIPAEGDTASPVEAMLGRGRSSMSPVTVLLLGILVAVILGFILTDEFRALLLAGTIIIGGVLLASRNGVAPGSAPGPAGPGAPGDPGLRGSTPQASSAGPYPTPPPPAAGTYPPPPPPPAGAYPVPPPPSAAAAPPVIPQPSGIHPSAPAGPPPQPSVAAPPPAAGSPRWTPPASSPPAGPGTPGGYRPPFAPRGPYAGARPGPYPPRPAPPPPPPPPRPTRERSPLAAATVSMIFLVLGLLAMLDLATAVDVTVSAYFAATLAVIALGLLVGAWFGRARMLIALGLVVAVGLGIATVVEGYDPQDGPTVWRPAGYDALATRYESNFGNSLLDLTRVDFTGREAHVTVEVNYGNLTVIVPPEVDVTAQAEVNVGSAQLFGSSWGGVANSTEVTDLGRDGTGGGNLRLVVEVNAGNVEVRR